MEKAYKRVLPTRYGRRYKSQQVDARPKPCLSHTIARTPQSVGDSASKIQEMFTKFQKHLVWPGPGEGKITQDADVLRKSNFITWVMDQTKLRDSEDDEDDTYTQVPVNGNSKDSEDEEEDREDKKGDTAEGNIEGDRHKVDEKVDESRRQVDDYYAGR